MVRFFVLILIVTLSSNVFAGPDFKRMVQTKLQKKDYPKTKDVKGETCENVDREPHMSKLLDAIADKQKPDAIEIMDKVQATSDICRYLMIDVAEYLATFSKQERVQKILTAIIRDSRNPVEAREAALIGFLNEEIPVKKRLQLTRGLLPMDPSNYRTLLSISEDLYDLGDKTEAKKVAQSILEYVQKNGMVEPGLVGQIEEIINETR